MTNEKKGEILPDMLGAYPVGYVPDGPLQRGALYRTENNRVRMYPPSTSVYQQNKARKRWEAERMEIYEEHKFEWLHAFLSRGSLPYINDSLKFNHYPPSNSENTQAWVWVYHKFLDDKEIINNLINEKGYIHIESGLGDCFTYHCSLR
ncbi:MAG: hypothetical protein PWQ51_372 [Methanolobus sp.]|jgi:hypothetical protein|nr:hypothetical protein [Methanolobus sp.]